MTISFYLKSFGKVFGSLTTLIGAFPFIGNYFLNNYLYIAPPIKIHFIFIFIIIFISCIYSVYYFKDLDIWKKRWGTPLVIIILLLISIVSFLFFFYWSQIAVRSIVLPDQNKTIYVIVGTERTNFAKTNFLDTDSDEDLLRIIGYLDEDIRRLWTKESINICKLYVACSYFITLLCIVTIFSVGVLKSCLTKP
jgi:hypothetical protein